MIPFHYFQGQIKEPLRKEGFFCVVQLLKRALTFFPPLPQAGEGRGEGASSLNKQSGNVLFYIFLAVGLLGALTYAFVKDSRENFAAQTAVSIAEAIFVQSNLIRSGIQQCAMEFPQGGGDMNGSGVIDTADNQNNPYPINPNSVLNTTRVVNGVVDPIAAAPDNKAKYLTCVGAPSAEANMFQGTNNQGRFLPPPPAGFTEWVYANDTNGVYLQITAPSDAASVNALNRIMTKFATCQADLDYGSCGARCFTVWVLRKVC